MFVWERALSLCLFFLCAAGEAPRGHCVGKKCWALFLESKNFTEAQSWCRVQDGRLYDVELWRGLPALPRGHFWVNRTVHEAGAKPEERCWSAAVAVAPEQVHFQNSTCTDKLDGFVCQYSVMSACQALTPSDGAHVNYTTAWGFQVKAVFPVGTVAVEHTLGRAPRSKSICIGTVWMLGPWSCEVMNGGCDHACDAATTPACTCPAGQTLHHNRFTCTEDPCAKCEPECVKEGGECRCRGGFRLGAGGRCVDVDECSEDRTLCSGPGQACQNLEGNYTCTCQEDYDEESGVCVDMSICDKCEQYCDLVQGSMSCVCRWGFRVNPQDPTKCEKHCTEQDCPAECVSQDQCYCPTGYINDQRDNGTVCTDINECEQDAPCEQHCVNTFGSFMCECEEGFQLLEYQCVLIEPSLVMGAVNPTASPFHPTGVPSYVKTGSILGITVFVMLCAALLYFLFYSLHQYCTKVQFYSLKHNMDIFTLQQVSTETYKRLSYDWQVRSDCHRV